MLGKYRKIAAVLVLAVFLGAGCAGIKDPSVYAVVDGVEITREEFNRYVGFLWFDPHEELTRDVKLQVLDEMIRVQVYSAAAVARGIEPDLEEAASDYESFRDQIIASDLFAGNATGYYTRMQELGLTEEWVIDVLAKFQIINLMVEEEREAVEEPDDEEIEAFYAKEKENLFAHEEMRRVRHILINEKNFPEADEEEIDELTKSLAQELYQRLLDGEDFEELAKEYSQDTSASNGGDIGFVEKDDVVKEFGMAAFTIEVGEISEPVKTKYGWHVLEVLEIKEPGFHELDEDMREWISASLYKQALDKRIDDLLTQLMEDAKIENNLE